MLIGLVYDLRDDYLDAGLPGEAFAEFDTVETIDAIAGALTRSGYAVDRIGNVKALAARLVAGDRWALVFNIAEGLAGRSREAQVPALLEAYDVPYTFSDPLTQALGLDKAMAKRVVRDAGLPTPAYAVLTGAIDDSICALPFPVFLKPVAEGTGKGCEPASKTVSPVELYAVAPGLRARFAQPVLAEAYLPGREFTVGVLGNGDTARAIGVLEIVLEENAEPGVYSFENKERCESRVTYRLADDAEARAAADVALAAYHALGCRDAARIDLRSDADGRPNFLEVNTLPGLHPTHSDLPILCGLAGVNYDHLIAGIVGAAIARCRLVRANLRATG